MKQRDKGRLGPFVAVLKETLDAPAWRAMSHGARSLYIALKRRYNQNNHNNGRLFISQRVASREIGSSFNQVARWFRELQHHGFIVQTQTGCLGIEGRGKAPHWRLTEIGYMNDPPTREFMRWDGTIFRDAVRPRKNRIPLRKTVTLRYGKP
jgi:DNA-binding transcriptional MocR family regulator